MEIDLGRVLCSLEQLPDGECRGFAIGAGDWPLRGFVINVRGSLHAFVNRCPHAGHPLNLRPHEFLTADGTLLLCRSHGALFEPATGRCVAGPCAGRTLVRIPLEVAADCVMLGRDVEPESLASSFEQV